MLTSNERLGVEYMLAWVNGDLEEEYRTAEQRSGADPSLVYNHANAALRTNRPGVALEVFETADLDSPFASLWAALWAIPPTAHHALGNHREALLAARRARSVYTEEIGVVNLELDALAALGATASVDSLLSVAERLGSAFNAPPMDTPGWSMIETSLELSAHGHVDASKRTVTRALDWYRTATARDSTSAALRFGRAIATYVHGDLSGARTQFERLLRDDPASTDYLGFLGAIAARQGDTARAESFANTLAAMDGAYLYGRQTRWRARIAALLGEHDRSLNLLRSAFQDGISLAMGQDWFWLHIDPDLASLRDRPDFIALSAPRSGS
jgi:tetratricopeptide (TPR) repeat protein